jgi:hypothetical protein
MLASTCQVFLPCSVRLPHEILRATTAAEGHVRPALFVLSTPR